MRFPAKTERKHFGRGQVPGNRAAIGTEPQTQSARPTTDEDSSLPTAPIHQPTAGIGENRGVRDMRPRR